jgi:hypothetical protein
MTSKKPAPGKDTEMPDITELRETLRVKLPDTYTGSRKELENFLL